MSISSLPSPYGIGTLGKAAYKFIDFLKNSGQRYWQLLPLGPTSYGDSPYASPSSFAGNPYFIDLDMLIQEGILSKSDISGIDWGSDKTKVDYGKIYENRFKVLRKAYENGRKKIDKELDSFYNENARWLENYALYMAVKCKYGMKPWTEWPDDIRLRKEEAVRSYSEELREEIDFWVFVQYLFFKQWNELRAYAKENGVLFIGDVPIYVAMDSADVWSETRFFQLDENCRPKEVSGVPPDDFTEDGQLWGNPLYDYDTMKSDGFGWWIRRIEGASKLYDVIRIDHFRGFESYWAVPYGDDTAKNGRWIKGPGMDLVGVLTSWFSNLEFIAEDLGYATPEVRKLLSDSKLPGMKVLEFAFDTNSDSDYLPHACTCNSCCYLGTHDNDTVLGWVDSLSKADKEFAKAYMHITEEEGWPYGMIRTGMSTSSNLFVMQMQDVLELGGDARMNTPGTALENWRWRMTKLPSPAKLRKITETYRRTEK